MLLAIDYQLDTPKEIVIVTPNTRAEAEPFLTQLLTTFLPNRALTIVESAAVSNLARRVPLVVTKGGTRWPGDGLRLRKTRVRPFDDRPVSIREANSQVAESSCRGSARATAGVEVAWLCMKFGLVEHTRSALTGAVTGLVVSV